MRNSVEQRLQKIQEMRNEIQAADDAIGELSPQERLVLDYLVLRPRPGGADMLCQLLGVERTTVYRRKSQVVAKLKKLLGW